MCVFDQIADLGLLTIQDRMTKGDEGEDEPDDQAQRTENGEQIHSRRQLHFRKYRNVLKLSEQPVENCATSTVLDCWPGRNCREAGAAGNLVPFV